MSDNTPAVIDAVSTEIRIREDDFRRALGPSVDADQWMVRAALAVAGDPAVLRCSPESITEALFQCAVMGAVPCTANTPQVERRVALVPYKGVVKVTPEARYFQETFRRAPKIKTTSATLVLDGDVIEFDGLLNVVSAFRKADPFASATRETVRGGFVTFITTDGTRYDHIVTRDRIDAAEAAAQSTKFWGPHWGTMALKTLWRDAAARVGALFVDSLSREGQALSAAVRALDESSGVVMDAELVERNAQPSRPALYDGKVKALRELGLSIVALGVYSGQQVREALVPFTRTGSGRANDIGDEAIDEATAALEAMLAASQAPAETVDAELEPGPVGMPPEHALPWLEEKIGAPAGAWTVDQVDQAWAMYDEAHGAEGGVE